MKELVSIVMPVHNAERYLEEAIRSVMTQTYLYWELLVIDDASTDRSMDIASALAAKDARIKVHRYIAFLDSDDVWLPGKLEHQLPFFNESEKIGVVFSNYEKIDEESERDNRVIKARKVTDYRKLLLGNVIGNVTAVYDTSRVGKAYFNKVHHEDYAMWLSILKRGFVARNTGEVMALYRVTGNSVSSHKLHLLSWQWNIYRNVEHLGFFRSVFCYLNYAVRGFFKSLV